MMTNSKAALPMSLFWVSFLSNYSSYNYSSEKAKKICEISIEDLTVTT